MNRKKRILQQNQAHNENHEDRVNMSHHLNGTFDVQQHYTSTILCSNNVLNPIMLNTQTDNNTNKKGKDVMNDKSFNNKSIPSYNDVPFTFLDQSMSHKQLPYNRQHLDYHGLGTSNNMLMHQTPIRALPKFGSIPVTCKSFNKK